MRRAAHLVDHVWPEVPVRQWVLTLPQRVRYGLAWHHELGRAVALVLFRAVHRHLRTWAHTRGLGAAGGGSTGRQHPPRLTWRMCWPGWRRRRGDEQPSQSNQEKGVPIPDLPRDRGCPLYIRSENSPILRPWPPSRILLMSALSLLASSITRFEFW